MTSTQDCLFETVKPQLISAEELANLLAISERSVWRRLSGGDIPEPVRIGKSVRWRLTEIIAWIEGGCLPLNLDPSKKGN